MLTEALLKICQMHIHLLRQAEFFNCRFNISLYFAKRTTLLQKEREPFQKCYTPSLLSFLSVLDNGQWNWTDKPWKYAAQSSPPNI